MAHPLHNIVAIFMCVVEYSPLCILAITYIGVAMLYILCYLSGGHLAIAVISCGLKLESILVCSQYSLCTTR